MLTLQPGFCMCPDIFRRSAELRSIPCSIPSVCWWGHQLPITRSVNVHRRLSQALPLARQPVQLGPRNGCNFIVLYEPQAVWKGDEIWLEVELQHFSLKGLAKKLGRFKANASRRGSAATSATVTPSSTTTSWAHSQAGARVSRTPLGSSEYPEVQVLNDTEECLRVMLVPETILTAQARARSQAAGLTLQIAGQGFPVEGSKETSDRRETACRNSQPSCTQRRLGKRSRKEKVPILSLQAESGVASSGAQPRTYSNQRIHRSINQDTKNPVNNDEQESHGYETVATGRWPYRTHRFKERKLHPGDCTGACCS